MEFWGYGAECYPSTLSCLAKVSFLWKRSIKPSVQGSMWVWLISLIAKCKSLSKSAVNQQWCYHVCTCLYTLYLLLCSCNFVYVVNPFLDVDFLSHYSLRGFLCNCERLPSRSSKCFFHLIIRSFWSIAISLALLQLFRSPILLTVFQVVAVYLFSDIFAITSSLTCMNADFSKSYCSLRATRTVQWRYLFSLVRFAFLISATFFQIYSFLDYFFSFK